MEHPSELVNFLNDLSLSGLEGLAEKNCEEIASKLKPLQESFRNHIEELRRKSVGNNTRMHLLDSTDDVEFVMKGIIDESSLKTQTEYINHWISKLKLCQNTITMLVNYLKKRCDHYKLHWQNYIEKDISNVRDARYLFLTVHKIYSKIYGLCQNLAIAICDYFNLYGKIQINIGKKKKDFRKPPVADPEITVSDRISLLDRETENCLLINPEKSILGFSAVRIELESYIIVRIQDLMRQHVRIKDGNNKRDVKLTSNLKTKDVFSMISDFFQHQKEYDALNTIHRISSRTIHRALPYPNYLSWGSLKFVLDRLEKMIDNLDPNDARLGSLIARLQSEGKLCIVSSSWYIK